MYSERALEMQRGGIINTALATRAALRLVYPQTYIFIHKRC